jgi:regulator of sigma E protease
VGGLIQTIAAFALILGGMIVIHEFGHFMVAKFFGIRVEIFSVGFGKRLWGFRKGDTDYRLSLIPLGGYVKMSGENLDEQATGAAYEFMSKPKWQRFCVAVAGPAMNILTALAIPAVMAMISFQYFAFMNQPAVVDAVDYESPAERAGIQRGDLILKLDGIENPTWRDIKENVAVNPGQDLTVTIKRGDEVKQLNLRVEGRDGEDGQLGYAGLNPDPGDSARIVVSGVVSGRPAAEAGLRAGDQILAVNGNPIDQSYAGIAEMMRTIRGVNGQPVRLTARRQDGSTEEVQATPKMDDGSWRLGFYPEVLDVAVVKTRLPFFQAISHSVDENRRIVQLTFKALGQVFAGRRKASETVAGPIQIARFAGQAASQGPASVFHLTSFLSLNLGLVNLLPIPVLDGGMIFMLLLESVLGLFGLPLTLRIKERMMQVGLVMLFLLMGFVIFNDVSKLLPGSDSKQPRIEQQQAPADK